MSEIKKYLDPVDDENIAEDAYSAAVPDNIGGDIILRWMRHYRLNNVLVINHEDGTPIGSIEFEHLRSLGTPSTLAWSSSVGGIASCPDQKPNFYVNPNDLCDEFQNEYNCIYHQNDDGKPVCHAKRVG